MRNAGITLVLGAALSACATTQPPSTSATSAKAAAEQAKSRVACTPVEDQDTGTRLGARKVCEPAATTPEG